MGFGKWVEKQKVALVTGKAEKSRIKAIESKEYSKHLTTEREVAARQRAKDRASTRVKYESKGGIVGQFVSGFKAPQAKKTITPTTTKYRYVKKGKHYVKKKVTTKAPMKQKEMPRKSLSEHMSQFKFEG